MAGEETLQTRELPDFEAIVRTGAEGSAKEYEFAVAVNQMDMEETLACYEVAYRARRNGIDPSPDHKRTAYEYGLASAETRVRGRLEGLIEADARERGIDVSLYEGHRGMPYEDYAWNQVHKIIKAINEKDGLGDVPFV